jgi:hypothetical protein
MPLTLTMILLVTLLAVQTISVGMTKAEVLQQFGKPTDVAGRVESCGPLGNQPPPGK